MAGNCGRNLFWRIDEIIAFGGMAGYILAEEILADSLQNCQSAKISSHTVIAPMEFHALSQHISQTGVTQSSSMRFHPVPQTQNQIATEIFLI